MLEYQHFIVSIKNHARDSYQELILKKTNDTQLNVLRKAKLSPHL
jgi:hypothetical protein